MTLRNYVFSTGLVLFAATILACNDGPPASNSSVDADLNTADEAVVHFTPGHQEPGYATRCFAGSPDRAKAILERHEFIGHNDVTGLVVERRGPALRLRYAYFNEPFVTDLEACPFTVADTKKTVSCAVRIGERGDLVAPAELRGYQRELDAQWRTLSPPSSVIDCSTKTLRNITNTWRQGFSVAQVLTIRAMLVRDKDLIASCASVGLVDAPGLEREQRWSGELGLELFTATGCPEVADASVVQMSVDAERAAWVKDVGTWTPWGLRIVSMECDGMPKIENPAWKDRSPLSANAANEVCK